MERYGIEALATVLLDNDRFQDEGGVWADAASVQATAPRQVPAAAADGHGGPGGGDLLERARRYIAKMPASVSGSGGHDAAWQAAQAAVRGFQLSDADAWTALSEFNDRYQPRWSEKELRHKLEDARDKSRLPSGYLLRGSGRPGGKPGVPANGRPASSTAGGATANGRAGAGAGDAAEEADDGYEPKVIDSETFFTNEYKLRWLVQGVLVALQPGVVGGPRKNLKTSILIDLAVSLGTATKFLGKFKVAQKCRVLVLSGESGEAVMQETARRVCAARGIDPKTMTVYWGFDLPQMAKDLHVWKLAKVIKELGIEVVIIDPLYLALLAGVEAKDIEAGNLYHIGPLLRNFAGACLAVGCTPLLCHHTRKNLAKPHEPVELEDLAFAGIGEFTRQWALVNRRKKYEPETGSHKLWLNVGGSAGQGGLWYLDVEEGELAEDFSGRRWEVAVQNPTEGREEERDEREEKREKQRARQVKKDGAAALNAIDRLADADGWAVFTKVRAAAHLNNDRMTRAVMDLEEEKIIERGQVQIATGTGYKTKRAVEALRRVRRTGAGAAEGFKVDPT
jgi:hypothetical protein